MNDHALQSSFEVALTSIVGRECWGVYRTFAPTLHFGRRIPIEPRTLNPKLPPELQHFEGEYILWLRAPWEVRREGELRCTSNDVERHAECLSLLEGRRVTEIEVDEANTIQISFDDGVDITSYPLAATYDAYYYYTPSVVFTVRSDGTVEMDGRTG